MLFTNDQSLTGGKQGSNTPVDLFVKVLYALAEHCYYGNLKEEIIRDCLVVGFTESLLSERMQVDGNLTLERAIETAWLIEMIRQQQNRLRGENSPETCSVDRVERKKSWKKYTPRPKQGQKFPNQAVKGQGKCPKCRYNHHQLESQCPAKNRKCLSCGRKGYFISMCLTKAVQEINEVDDSVFLGFVTAGRNPWMVELGVGNRKIKFKIDTLFRKTCSTRHREEIPLSIIKPLETFRKRITGFRERTLKEDLQNTPVQDIYVKETKVSSDALSFGLGAVVMQK